jgi:hypothetical protein
VTIVEVKIIKSNITPSAYLDFGLPSFRLPSGTALHMALCGRSSEFGLFNSPSSSKLLFLGDIPCGEPFSQKRAIGSLSLFGSTHVTLPSRSWRSLTLSNVPGVITTDIFAGRRSTYLQFGYVTRVLKYTNSLATSKFLSPKATVCPASKMVLFLAAIMCFVFCSLIFSLTFAVSASSDR